MSYNKDKKEKNNKIESKRINSELEKDTMNIKSHLNASLDLSGISVSEDLINRTLEAIKQKGTEPDADLKITAAKGTVQNKTEKETKQRTKQVEEHKDVDHKKNDTDNIIPMKKVIPLSRYIRRFAGAAAALLVVTAGVYFINNVKPKYDTYDLTSNSVSDKSENESAASKTASNPTEEAVEGSTGSVAAQATTGTEASDTTPQFTIAPNTADDSVAIKFAAGDQASEEPASGTSPDTQAASTEAESKSAVNEPTQDAGDTAKKSSAPRGLVASTPVDLGAPEEKAGGGGGSDNDGASQDTGSDNGDTSLSESAMVTANKSYFFTDIFLSAPEQAQYVRITRISDQESVILTTTEDIQNFYSFLELTTFTDRTDACTAPVSYTIEVKSLQPEEDTYTMTIADGIIITCDTGESVGQSLYDTGDIALFTKNMGEFFDKYHSVGDTVN